MGHFRKYKSRNDRKRTFEQVHLERIQISLRICAVWSDLGAFWNSQGMFLHVDNEDNKECFLTLQHIRSMPLDPGHCTSY